jgi:hypothetical protein
VPEGGLHNLYSLQRVSGRIRWVEHKRACEVRNAYKILIKKPVRKGQVKKAQVKVTIILKQMSQKHKTLGETADHMLPKCSAL